MDAQTRTRIDGRSLHLLTQHANCKLFLTLLIKCLPTRCHLLATAPSTSHAGTHDGALIENVSLASFT